MLILSNCYQHVVFGLCKLSEIMFCKSNKIELIYKES